MGNASYTPYTCAAINDILTRESGRITGEIYDRLRESSPWIRLTDSGAFPMGMGVTINNLTFERTFNNSVEPTWNNVTLSDGSDASACLPTVEEVSFGQTQRSYRLQHYAIEGPDLCLNDLRTNYELSSQLARVMDQLTGLSEWVWENRYKNEYLRLAGNMVIARPNLPISDSETFPAGQFPTSILTQGILDRLYMKLIRDGAGRQAVARAGGAPVFTLITGAESSDEIKFKNADVREDLRWASPERNLEPLGISHSHRGFVHVVDPYPPRYDDVGGVLTRREVWTSSAATKGNKFEINSTYETAEYEVSFIHVSRVFRSLKAPPVSNPGGDVRFDPQRNMGDFRWLNIVDRKCNPDGTIGFHRAVFSDASEPVSPQYGFAILHKRCNSDLDLTGCTYS